MGDLDDFPPQNPVQHIEDNAEAAFEAALRLGSLFAWQQRDRRDFGTDYQLEVLDRGQRTNFRVHVQLKGTDAVPNADGSFSISVPRTNLNYLLTHPSSIYVCYSLRTKQLLVRTADDVFRLYEANKMGERIWTEQSWITVRFLAPFDQSFQQRLQRLVLSTGKAERNRRLEWRAAPPGKIKHLTTHNYRPIPVPLERPEALCLLERLYQQLADDITISSSFDQFHAVLSDNEGALSWLYMAEINLGMNGYQPNRERIKAAIQHLEDAMSRRRITKGSGHYAVGNAWQALGDYEKAITQYRSALKLLSNADSSELAAQCWTNLGIALHEAGHVATAKSAYETALTLDPELAEAHLEMGIWHARHGNDPALTLHHLDSISKRPGSSLSMHLVNAWRAQALFKTGQEGAAFNAINSLISDESQSDWEWPWSARLVSEHGCSTLPGAKKSLTFWRRFLEQHPDNKYAQFEKFNCLWWLHQEGEDTRTSFADLKKLAALLIAQKVGDEARIWDQVGHWAQKDRDWCSAEAAYQQAAALNEKYNYCLGTALNNLGKHQDALRALRPESESAQTDALSCFQIAFAQEHLGNVQGAADAYARAIELDPEYAVAHFNLGGLLWNNGDTAIAIEVWAKAIDQFPEHELSKKLKTDLPALFG